MQKDSTLSGAERVPAARAVVRRTRNAAAALTLLSMSSVQFGAALSAPVMDRYGASATTWLRLCWGALALALIVRPPLRRYTRGHWLAAGTLGVAMACMTLCFFAAIQPIPLGLAVAIDFLGPLSVAAYGAHRARALCWPLLAIGGVLLLAHERGGWAGDPLGIALACAAAVGWGSYIVLMKRVGAIFAGMEGLAVSLLAAAAVAAPFGLADRALSVPPAGLAETAGLALLVPLLPYALEMVALRHLPAASFGILMSIEPAIGALAGFVVLHQAMSVPQLIGTACVVCASVGAVTGGGSPGEA